MACQSREGLKDGFEGGGAWTSMMDAFAAPLQDAAPAENRSSAWLAALPGHGIAAPSEILLAGCPHDAAMSKSPLMSADST